MAASSKFGSSFSPMRYISIYLQKYFQMSLWLDVKDVQSPTRNLRMTLVGLLPVRSSIVLSGLLLGHVRTISPSLTTHEVSACPGHISCTIRPKSNHILLLHISWDRPMVCSPLKLEHCDLKIDF